MKCGSTATTTGRPCGFQVEHCPHRAHARTCSDPERHGTEVKPGARTSVTPAAPAATESSGREAPPAVADHDLRGVAWWTVASLISGEIQGREASALTSLIRTLHALGPEPADQDEVLAEIELRGAIMNGIPPRTEEQWALAKRLFDEESLEEFREWEKVRSAED